MKWGFKNRATLLAVLQETTAELDKARRNAVQCHADRERDQATHRELESSYATELALSEAAADKQKNDNHTLLVEKDKLQCELIDCLKLLREQDDKLGLLRRDLADSEFEGDQLRVAFRCASEYSLQLESDKRAAESVFEYVCSELAAAAATATAVTGAAARAAEAAAASAAVAAAGAGGSGRSSPTPTSEVSIQSEGDLGPDGGANASNPDGVPKPGATTEHHPGEAATDENRARGSDPNNPKDPRHEEHQQEQPSLDGSSDLRGDRPDGTTIVPDSGRCGAGSGAGAWRGSSGCGGVVGEERSNAFECCHGGSCRCPGAQRLHCDGDGEPPQSPAPDAHPTVVDVGGPTVLGVRSGYHTRPRRGRPRPDAAECRRSKGVMETAVCQTMEAVEGLEAAVAQLRALCQQLHRAVVDGEAAGTPADGCGAASAAEARAQASAAAAAAAAAAALGGAAAGGLRFDSRPPNMCVDGGASPPRPPATPPRAPAALMYFSNLVTPKPRRTGAERQVPGCDAAARGGRSSCQGGSAAHGGGGAAAAAAKPPSLQVDDLWRSASRHAGAASSFTSTLQSATPRMLSPTAHDLGLAEALPGWASYGSSSGHTAAATPVRSAVVVQGRPMARAGGAGGVASPPSPVSSLMPSPTRSSCRQVPGAVGPSAVPPAAPDGASDKPGAIATTAAPSYLGSPAQSPSITHSRVAGAAASPAVGGAAEQQGSVAGASGGSATGAAPPQADMEVVSLRLTNEALQRQVAELQRQNDLLQLRQLATAATATTPGGGCMSGGMACPVLQPACGMKTPQMAPAGPLGALGLWGPTGAAAAGPGGGAGGTGTSQPRLLGALGGAAVPAAAAAASTCSLPAAAAFYYGSLPPGRPQTGEQPLYSGPHHAVPPARAVAAAVGGAGGRGGATCREEPSAQAGARARGGPPPDYRNSARGSSAANDERRGGSGVGETTPVGASAGDGHSGSSRLGAVPPAAGVVPPFRPGPPGHQPASGPSSLSPMGQSSEGAASVGLVAPEARPPAAAARVEGFGARGQGPGAVLGAERPRDQPSQPVGAWSTTALASPAPAAAAEAAQDPQAPLVAAASGAAPPPGVDPALWELEMLVACSKGLALSG